MLRFAPRPRIIAAAVGLAFLLFGRTSAAQAGDLYFVAIFGAQRVPNCPKYSHSFATFVKASGAGPHGAPCRVESHTISWLPETLDIHVFRPCPEPGVNFDLHDTLRLVLAQGDRVSVWGPYQIRKELYDRALGQIARLESATVQYEALDTAHRTAKVCNCIHAISDLARSRHRLRIASPGFGEVASYHITKRLEPWFIAPEEIHAWVNSCLGLDAYPLIHRDLRDAPRLLPRPCFPPLR
jgi:hypothetical protein